ncbi:MAG: hypothetical protein IJC48_04835 [Clostridia bacterium]|nr:hypothetical protein [Clostridia bacterium]
MEGTFDKAIHRTQKFWTSALARFLIETHGEKTSRARKKHIEKMRKKSAVLMYVSCILAVFAICALIVNVIELSYSAKALETVREGNRLLEAKAENLMLEKEMEMRIEVVQQRAEEILGMVEPEEMKMRNLEFKDGFPSDAQGKRVNVP